MSPLHRDAKPKDLCKSVGTDPNQTLPRGGVMSTPISLATLGTQVNTELTKAFRQIVTAGWANKSDGNVEANTGHFALITIEPNEMPELIDAVFDGEEV